MLPHSVSLLIGMSAKISTRHKKILILSQFLKNTKQLQVPLLTAKMQYIFPLSGENIETTRSNLFIVTTVEVSF